MFTTPAPTRSGYTEVRVGITMRNVFEVDIGYRPDAFFADPMYPRLGLLDGSGREWPLVAAHSTRALLPGSTLTVVPPQLTGRWTAGFQVPAESDDDLSLVVHAFGGRAVIDLAAPEGESLAETPPGVTQIGMGDVFAWGDQFTAAATDHGRLVCGDPLRQLVVEIVAVAFDVTNTSDVAADWPGVRFPDTLAIAQWPDGATARFAYETYAGDFDPLLKWAEDATRFPPGGDGASYSRALLFAAPRDARVSSLDDGPRGVWLQPDGAEQVWLDLSSPGSLAMTPTLCDDGDFSFAIPYSFGPGATFAAGLAPPDPDPGAQDSAARRLLSEALVVAGNYRAANDDSYANMTAGTLSALWNGITFRDGFVTEVGAVGVRASTDSEGVIRGILVTESASGQIFCLTDGPDGLTFSQADNDEDAEAQCDPASVAAAAAAAAEEAAAEAEAEATATP